MSNDDLVTLPQIAQRLGYAVGSVYRWQRTGFFPPFPPHVRTKVTISRRGGNRVRQWEWRIVEAWFERTQKQHQRPRIV